MKTGKIIVAITGASGAPIGIRLLEELAKDYFELHTIVSEGAKKVIEHECQDSLEEAMENIRKLSSGVYEENEIDARIASGSFQTDAMIIIPCSMKSLSAIAHGYSGNLITRAADVMIKHKRKLILVPREAPLSSIHLRNMLALSDLGVWIVPPVIAFYNKPKKVEDNVNFIVGKVLEILNIDHGLYEKWNG